MTNAKDDPHTAASLEEQLDHAAEELITSDSDDPPLSEEEAVEMIRMIHRSKLPGLRVDGGIILAFLQLLIPIGR